MKKIVFTFLATLCFFLNYAQSWTQSANLPALGRRGAISLSINGKIYVGGGLDSAGVLLSDFYMFDPGTNTWTQKANLPINLGGAACFTVNGKGYLASGASGVGNVVSNVYQYDPVFDVWTAEAAFPGTARENSYGFSVGDTGYVFAGFGGSELNDLWAYNTTNNTWTQKTSMPSSVRSTISGFVINGIAYTGLGEYNSSANYASDMGAYNAATNTWTTIAQFPGHLRSGQICFTIGNFGYVGMGEYDSLGSNVYLSDIYQYNPANNSWLRAGDFPGPGTSTATGQNVGDIIYVGLGSNASFQTDWWRYIYHVGVTLAPGQTVCSGSNLILNPVVAGAIAPVRYSWTATGNSLSCDTCPNPSVTLTQNSTFIIAVTDANNTVAYDTVSYAVSPTASAIQATLTNTNISCLNPTDTTTAVVANGIIPLTFQWGDGATGTGISPGLHTYGQAGVYVFTVIDSAGCLSSVLDTVVNTSVAITLGQTVSPICLYDSSGKIYVNVTGGITPYAFAWSTGATTDSIIHLPAGDYAVTVTDATGCSTQFFYELNPASDVWDYYIYLTGSEPNCSNNGSLIVTPYGGFSPFNYLWSNGATTQSIQSLGAGNYSVIVTDSAGCPRRATGSLSYNCASVISGYVFVDSNQNCSLDSSEYIIQYVYVTATSAATGYTYYGTTDWNGLYTIVVSDTGTYNLQVANYEQQCSNFTICGNPSQNITISVLGDSSANNNFGASYTSGYDLTLHPGWTSADPGFQKEYWIMPYSQANIPFSGTATIVFKYDSNLIYQYSLPPLPAVDTIAHTLTWNYDSVPWPSFDWVNARFQTFFTVPSTLSLGYLLQSSFSITPTSGDCDSSNNFLSFSESVIGSHDPNEKTVSPAGAIPETDSVLTYTIHFQNTGTDSTHFIVVVDTLSKLLDPTSVRNVASSSPYSKFSVSGQGVVNWEFNPYRLVDSLRNPSGSKGFVTFQVKKKANVPVGTSISNTATIYFDYNDGVVTNTITDTVVVAPTAISVVPSSGVSVQAFPNPFAEATNIIVTGLNEKFDFELYDVTGRMVKSISSIQNKQFQVNRDDLSSGVYLYRILVNNRQVAFGKLAAQ